MAANVNEDHGIAKVKDAAGYRRDTKFHEDLLTRRLLHAMALPQLFTVEGGVQLLYKG
jgi:glc operon protein GlcG